MLAKSYVCLFRISLLLLSTRMAWVLRNWRKKKKKPKMEEILAGVWCMLLVFGCLASLLWKRRQTSRSEREHQDEPQPQQVISISNLKVGFLFISSWLIRLIFNTLSVRLLYRKISDFFCLIPIFSELNRNYDNSFSVACC